jgi:NACHT domain-containing protein
VLGDPGAGKSVAFRKLSIEMLREVPQTGRVPIYVNLREWLPREHSGTMYATAQRWTEDNKPTVKDLGEFVIKSVSKGDVFMEDFVNTYFHKMWEHGRLFFVLDSFDEIPELLDVDEDSWLIDHLSKLM